jgi:CubicO group peptidase (beta-lactamase class C family)
MKPRLLFLAFLCLPLISTAEVPLRSRPEVSSAITLLETWIAEQMEYRGLPGLSLAVVFDREIVWSRGFGVADLLTGAPVTPHTVFRIASITKTFTSTAIMILRDEGKLALDDPVSRYLPWFSYKNRFPAGPEVTIRHLLTHTSGLPREAAFPYWTDHRFPTMEQIIEAFQRQESIFEPETRFKYSNLGMTILGEVVAAASGQTYADFVARRILVPLGMVNSAVTPDRNLRARMATGYGRRLADHTHVPFPYTDAKGITAAANIASTAEDLALFAIAHLREDSTGPGQLLKASTLREMHRVQWLQPSWKSGWGLGFSINKSGERLTFGHAGWVAGHRSQLTVSPAEKVAVIVMTNADDGEPAMYASRLLAMLAPAIARATEKPKVEPVADSTWSIYVGRYTDPSGWDSEVLIHNGQLTLYDHRYPPEEDPQGSIVNLTPEGSHTFRMTGENGNGELVRFEVSPDGAVRRVKVGENYITPKR